MQRHRGSSRVLEEEGAPRPGSRWGAFQTPLLGREGKTRELRERRTACSVGSPVSSPRWFMDPVCVWFSLVGTASHGSVWASTRLSAAAPGWAGRGMQTPTPGWRGARRPQQVGLSLHLGGRTCLRPERGAPCTPEPSRAVGHEGQVGARRSCSGVCTCFQPLLPGATAS